MSDGTSIEWCTATFNPWWGCTKVSPGCDHCYAENLARRFGTSWGPSATRREFGDDHWNDPRRWNERAKRDGKPFRVFCASMADVFDNDAPAGARERLWALIRETPHLTWLLLTKRIGNAEAMLPVDWGRGYANVWLGATIINQPEADRDVVKLLRTSASVRFVSVEPMLAQVDLTRVYGVRHSAPFNALNPRPNGYVRCVSHAEGYCMGDCEGRLPGLDWVICGGESGRGARPMHPDWARSLRDQCAAAGVPFLFKQVGHWASQFRNGISSTPEKWVSRRTGLIVNAPSIGDQWAAVWPVGKKAAGRHLDGVQHDGFPS